MPGVGFTRDGGVCPCQFGFNPSTHKVLQLFETTALFLHSLLGISAPSKAVLRRVSGKDASRMSNHAKSLPKTYFWSPKEWQVILSSGGVEWHCGAHGTSEYSGGDVLARDYPHCGFREQDFNSRCKKISASLSNSAAMVKPACSYWNTFSYGSLLRVCKICSKQTLT